MLRKDSTWNNLYVDWKFALIHSAAWMLVAFLTMSESVFFYQINDRDIPWQTIVVNDSFYVLWWMVSPGLIMIVR